jgi:hypothetical protein
VAREEEAEGVERAAAEEVAAAEARVVEVEAGAAAAEEEREAAPGPGELMAPARPSLAVAAMPVTEAAAQGRRVPVAVAAG